MPVGAYRAQYKFAFTMIIIIKPDISDLNAQPPTTPLGCLGVFLGPKKSSH